MCQGLPHAIRPTHGVVTATLIVPPVDGGGQVSLAPPESTYAMTGSASTPSVPASPTVTANTTARTSMATRSSPSPSPSTWSTWTRTSASETETPTSVPAGARESKQRDGSGGSLTAAQKAGITVGVVGLAGLAIGIIVLFRLYRRRQRDSHRRSDSTEALHRRDTWGYKVDKGGSSGGNSWLARPNHPVPPPPPPDNLATPPDNLAPPGRYVSTTWRPSAIGLALSPGHHATRTTTPTRPVSKLLPAKPAMALGAANRTSCPDEAACPQVRLVHASPPYMRSRTPPPAPPKLHIPEQGGGTRRAAAGPLSRPGLGRRDSSMTEFEEDGRATSLSPEGQIWRPPSTGAAPHSATTYYVADKHGNWVLGNPEHGSHAGEAGVTTPATAATPKPGVANAIMLPAAQKALKVESRSPLLTAEQQPQQDGTTAARTAPQAPGARHTEPPPSAALASPELRQRAFPPRPLFSSVPPGQTRRARAESADSGVTTIATLSDEDCDYDDGGGPLQQPVLPLSPVTESPRSDAIRRSPVSYPRVVAGGGGRRFSCARAPAGERPIVLGTSAPHHQLHHHTSRAGQGPAGPRPARRQPLHSAPRPGGAGEDDYAGPHLPCSSSTMRLVEPSPSPPDESDRGQLPSASRVHSLRLASSNPAENPAKHAQNSSRHGSAQPPRRPPSNWVSEPPADPHAPMQAAPRQPVTPWLPQPWRPQNHGEPPCYSYRCDDYDYDYDDYDLEHYRRLQHQQRKYTFANPPRPPLPHPAASSSSSSASASSLIAKRLGPARAAHMAITTATDPPFRRRTPPHSPANQHGQQQRQPRSAGAANSSSRAWRRQSASGPLFLSPELVTPRSLPGHGDDSAAAAPSWVPRLTPTRRGEHLYLDVR